MINLLKYFSSASFWKAFIVALPTFTIKMAEGDGNFWIRTKYFAR